MIKLRLGEEYITKFWWEHLKKPGRKWKYYTTVCVAGIGWEVVDGIHPAHDRYMWRPLVNIIMNLQVP
jgi:hypothetical protein